MTGDVSKWVSSKYEKHFSSCLPRVLHAFYGHLTWSITGSPFFTCIGGISHKSVHNGNYGFYSFLNIVYVFWLCKICMFCWSDRQSDESLWDAEYSESIFLLNLTWMFHVVLGGANDWPGLSLNAHLSSNRSKSYVHGVSFVIKYCDLTVNNFISVNESYQ